MPDASIWPYPIEPPALRRLGMQMILISKVDEEISYNAKKVITANEVSNCRKDLNESCSPLYKAPIFQLSFGFWIMKSNQPIPADAQIETTGHMSNGLSQSERVSEVTRWPYDQHYMTCGNFSKRNYKWFLYRESLDRISCVVSPYLPTQLSTCQ